MGLGPAKYQLFPLKSLQMFPDSRIGKNTEGDLVQRLFLSQELPHLGNVVPQAFTILGGGQHGNFQFPGGPQEENNLAQKALPLPEDPHQLFLGIHQNQKTLIPAKMHNPFIAIR